MSSNTPAFISIEGQFCLLCVRKINPHCNKFPSNENVWGLQGFKIEMILQYCIAKNTGSCYRYILGSINRNCFFTSQFKDYNYVARTF